MCTQPVLPGTACSRHVRPRSLEIITALWSLSPDQRTPGTVRQWKIGSSQSLPCTTTGWRTKTPAPSNSGSGALHVLPWSMDRRQRTIAVSWLPDRCAVCSSHKVPSGAGKRIGFCSERSGSFDNAAGSLHFASPLASDLRENHTLMSATPSCVPPNQTQPSSFAPSGIRFAAWHWIVGAGRSSATRSPVRPLAS